MLQSRRLRLVVRKTNQHTIVQFVGYEPDGDVVLASARTNQLEKLGWKHHTANVPAAYLAGFLAGKAAMSAGVKDAVVDIGLQKAHAGGRLFAAVKGAVDAGVKLPVDEAALPDEERIRGAHMEADVAKSLDTIKDKAGK